MDCSASKKPVLWLVLIMFLLLFTFLSGFVCYAEENSVKIGLFYSNSARDEYGLASDENLIVGNKDEVYYDLGKKSVTVKYDNLWHIEYYTVSSLQEASFEIEKLKTQGLDAFLAIKGNEIKVYGGSFENENDCLWAAQNLAVQGTVVAPESGNLGAFADNKLMVLGSGITIGSLEEKVDLTAVATKEYRGKMMFLPYEGKINAINVVEREEYLYSVISREMSPSWHIEALKAQAVCARNYVENNRGKHGKYGFDLCDSVCCQAYAGTSSETKDSYPPVDETKDELLMFDGEVAQTFYSSSMGPTTEDVRYVWGSKFPYLTSVENPYEDYENVYNGKWEKSLTKERATEIMNSKGYSIGDVVEIKALEFSPSGRVIKLLVKGTKGEKTFERESCRLIFSEITLSQFYTISGGGAIVYPSLDLKSDDDVAEKETSKITVLTKDGKKSMANDVTVLGSGGKKKIYKAIKSGDAYVFSGYGWGHGIGMSQFGAKCMAEEGFSYEEILTHYFKGTEIEKQ